MFSFLRRVAPVVGLLAVSQALNALSLALIPLLLDPMWADAFALGLQVGTAAYGGVVLGVVYNLAIGRPGFSRWGLAALLAAVFSLVLGSVTVLATVMLSHNGVSIPVEGMITVGVFSVGGAALAIGGTGGVREACMGRPVRLTSINVLPASALLAGLLTVSLLHISPLFAAAIWTSAAIAQIAFLWRPSGKSSVTSRQPKTTADKEIRHPARRDTSATQHAISLGVGVLASTVIPTLYITALTQLPPGSTALAFVVVRIATSIVGIGVNSLLLVRYNWDSGTRDIRTLLTVLSVAATIMMVGSVLGEVFFAGVTGLAVLVCTWIILLVASAVSLRETNARRLAGSITVKVAIDVTLSVAGCVLLFAAPSLGSYFGLLVLSQAVTMLVTTAFFGYRRAALLSVVTLAGALLWVTQAFL